MPSWLKSPCSSPWDVCWVFVCGFACVRPWWLVVGSLACVGPPECVGVPCGVDCGCVRPARVWWVVCVCVCVWSPFSSSCSPTGAELEAQEAGKTGRGEVACLVAGLAGRWLVGLVARLLLSVGCSVSWARWRLVCGPLRCALVGRLVGWRCSRVGGAVVGAAWVSSCVVSSLLRLWFGRLWS